MKPSSSQPPGLYIVATPIGNLADITLRALEVLKSADRIACEDTRVTAKLLTHYGIKKPLLSYNDHNAARRRPELLAAMKNGQRVALVSDAGTPLISDPGYKLVREAVAEGIAVTALPGASSVMAALCLSGLPTDRFFFAGFLPARKEARRRDALALASVPATLVLFESARRLKETLPLLHETLGAREAAVARELTKLYEECRRGSLADLAAHYAQAGEPKGEVVIVIGPPAAQAHTQKDVDVQLRRLLSTHSVKEAAALVAAATGAPKRDVYAQALAIKNP